MLRTIDYILWLEPPDDSPDDPGTERLAELLRKWPGGEGFRGRACLLRLAAHTVVEVRRASFPSGLPRIDLDLTLEFPPQGDSAREAFEVAFDLARGLGWEVVDEQLGESITEEDTARVLQNLERVAGEAARLRRASCMDLLSCVLILASVAVIVPLALLDRELGIGIFVVLGLVSLLLFARRRRVQRQRSRGSW